MHGEVIKPKGKDESLLFYSSLANLREEVGEQERSRDVFSAEKSTRYIGRSITKGLTFSKWLTSGTKFWGKNRGSVCLNRLADNETHATS